MDAKTTKTANTTKFKANSSVKANKNGVANTKNQKTKKVIRKRWYQETWFMLFMLFFCTPVGLFLLWRYSDFGIVVKSIITFVVVALIVLLLLAYVLLMEAVIKRDEEKMQQYLDQQEQRIDSLIREQRHLYGY